ncbi:type IV secretion system protein [Thiopseudomonas alkaliphila]|uniref:type IV secretion system protein n=1 Tax=Thiopseudomonas alkaliphila TaxID=1697053 RepID=UPI002581BED1|nr:type IV secretion system protein [Thiopseudomonas alkaliphila]
MALPLLSTVYLKILFAIGPLFILMLMWPVTARFFDQWFGFVINHKNNLIIVSPGQLSAQNAPFPHSRQAGAACTLSVPPNLWPYCWRHQKESGNVRQRRTARVAGSKCCTMLRASRPRQFQR